MKLVCHSDAKGIQRLLIWIGLAVLLVQMIQLPRATFTKNYLVYCFTSMNPHGSEVSCVIIVLTWKGEAISFVCFHGSEVPCVIMVFTCSRKPYHLYVACFVCDWSESWIILGNDMVDRTKHDSETTSHFRSVMLMSTVFRVHTWTVFGVIQMLISLVGTKVCVEQLLHA